MVKGNSIRGTRNDFVLFSSKKNKSRCWKRFCVNEKCMHRESSYTRKRNVPFFLFAHSMNWWILIKLLHPNYIISHVSHGLWGTWRNWKEGKQQGRWRLWREEGLKWKRSNPGGNRLHLLCFTWKNCPHPCQPSNLEVLIVDWKLETCGFFVQTCSLCLPTTSVKQLWCSKLSQT